jgi:hypothetical protein
MSVGRMGARAALVAVGVLVSVAFMAVPSWATGGTKLCIPTGENAPVKTPLKNGTCANKYTLTELGAEGKEGKEGPKGATGPEGPEGKNALSSEELTTLKGILPCITSVEKGIAGKPTVQFHGCNVQIVNGAGSTATTNGAGNLIIGYDENTGFARLSGGPGAQTGSHDLIIGQEQEFTSYGGLVAGAENNITGPSASITGGEQNTASGTRVSSVSGGAFNTASGLRSSVSGGDVNTASGEHAWVGGGVENKAEGFASAIFGGKQLTAKGAFEAIP